MRILENGMPWKMFRPNRDEGIGEWRRLHNENLRDLHSSSNFIQMIKLRRMRGAGHVAQKGEKRGDTEF